MWTHKGLNFIVINFVFIVKKFMGVSQIIVKSILMGLCFQFYNTPPTYFIYNWQPRKHN